MIKIKDFSHKTHFSVRMLRYLEEIGLLIPKRNGMNYRIYSQDQLAFATQIKQLQNLGIQFKEIALLMKNGPSVQIEILKKVLKRELEIAEIKSESIPQIKSMIEYIQLNNCPFENYWSFANKGGSQVKQKKLKTLDCDNKFQRVVYNIPFLKILYEEYLEPKAKIELLTTDAMKFGTWIDECSYVPQVFSIFDESSFSFGLNISNNFLAAYEESWRMFAGTLGIQKLNNFRKKDIKQMLGIHDIIIKTTFVYRENKVAGELIIPYSPIYTMSQLSHKS